MVSAKVRRAKITTKIKNVLRILNYFFCELNYVKVLISIQYLNHHNFKCYKIVNSVTSENNARSRQSLKRYPQHSRHPDGDNSINIAKKVDNRGIISYLLTSKLPPSSPEVVVDTIKAARTGKSCYMSLQDSLLLITCTGTAGFNEHKCTSFQLVKFINPTFFQSHLRVPPSFRYPAQMLLSVPQKIIHVVFRYVLSDPCWAIVAFSKQLPVHLNRKGIKLKQNTSECDCSSDYWYYWILSMAQIYSNNEFLRTLFSLLITIHPNPGPVETRECSVIAKTYNVNGLGDENKTKRILNKLIKDGRSKIPTVIALQETHLTDGKIRGFNNKWRYQSVNSCFTSSSAGVSLLYFGHQWAAVDGESVDDEGRICSLTVRTLSDERFTFLSIYVPSSNRESIKFIDTLESFCLDIVQTYPDTSFILMGDFNYTTDQNDFNTRVVSPIETILRLKMSMLIETLEIKDSYRQIHLQGGFTWGHKNASNTRSRIDRIFVSKTLKVLDSNVITDFDQSDHSMVITSFEINNPNPRGPGCYKINPTILDNESIKNEIREQIIDVIKSTPDHFDPHLKFDYVKMNIRNIFMKANSIEARSNKFELECAEKELNTLHEKLNRLTVEGYLEADISVRMLKLEIKRCTESVDRQRSLEAKNLIYLSRAKWAEEGEKSSKYFLNLIKNRSADSSIQTIRTQNGCVTGQELVEKEIYIFYKELYSQKDTINDPEIEDLFLSHNPKISDDKKVYMDSPLTLLDLYNAVQTCKDSAPGPDAIPYSVYKHFWQLLGPLLLESWRYSVTIGRMSQEQRQSVITLIPKKDKDKTILSNLRPISLTNTDVKIITKAITIKLNPILDQIISPTQTAYVPKRQVTDNTFLLDKIIQLAEKTEENLFILSLDAKKAFDSIDHEYMYKTLKSFGFGDEFIFTIRTIYKDLTASVLVNGYKTQILQLLRGVKQGDALSCALFIICVEPFFRAIHAAQNIKGFSVRSPFTLETTECKLAGYADDFAPILSNIESVEEVFALYYKFSQLSGVYLNPDKTEVIKIGPHQNDPEDEIYVTYGHKTYLIKSSKRIVICGVSHPIDSPESYVHNISNKIAKMKQLLNSWRCRSLSIIGKILITKVYGLSQLIYFLQTCHITNDDLKLIERSIFSFIWSAKTSRPNDKIKRSVLKCSISDGGLNAPDIFSLNRALKFKKWLRSALNVSHPVSIVQDRLLFMDGIADKFPQEIHKQVISGLSCQFYRLSLETNNFLSNINYKELYMQHVKNEVMCDQLTFLASHPLASSIYLQNKQNRQQILRRASMMGVSNLGALINFHKNNPHGLAWLEMQQCLKAFPKLWVALLSDRDDWKLNSYTNELIFIGNGKWQNGTFISTRQIRQLLSKQSETPVDKIDILHKHQLEQNILNTIPSNPFELTGINSVYMKAFQYKILHRAYTTRSKLYLYKILESPICPFCEEADDNFEHALYKCELSSQTWSNFQSWLNNYDIPIQLQLPHIIMGINEMLPHGQLLNTILNRIKLILISPKENRRSLSIEELENIVLDQLHLEKVSYSYNKKHSTQWQTKHLKFEKRWGHLLNVLNR